MQNTPQIAQTGLFDLIWQAGPMAKLVLLILLTTSILCWAIIFMKWKIYKQAQKENTDFLHVFWYGKNLDEIFSKSDKFQKSPTAGVFRAGYKEFRKIFPTDETLTHLDSAAIENIQRALVRASTTEVSALERYVSWLATTASAAPFVGLFGTVWGIMTSFQNIGATGAANLAVVAPGISEALITTAAGIGAAVPAVIAYNQFAQQTKRVATDMDCFIQDFLNIIQRSTLKKSSS